MCHSVILKLLLSPLTLALLISTFSKFISRIKQMDLLAPCLKRLELLQKPLLTINQIGSEWEVIHLIHWIHLAQQLICFKVYRNPVHMIIAFQYKGQPSARDSRQGTELRCTHPLPPRVEAVFGIKPKTLEVTQQIGSPIIFTELLQDVGLAWGNSRYFLSPILEGSSRSFSTPKCWQDSDHHPIIKTHPITATHHLLLT